MTENTIKERERTSDVIVQDRSSFENLFLSKITLDGLKENKFHKPSPIQVKAIPLGKCGFDLIIKSKSGTGKTAVFAVIALEMVKLKKNIPQALILAPTREIAYQITGVIKDLGKFYEGLKVDHFIGGLDLKADIAKVNTCHIIVGTPGRVKHLISAKYINVAAIKLFILDEADKLLCDSLQPEVNYVFNSLPKEKQVIASSATYPDKLDEFVSRYMMNPTFISPNVDSPLLLGLKQFVSIVDSNLNTIYQMKIKNKEIQRILSGMPFTQCVIFCNFQSRAESMCNSLNQSEWKAAYITGAQSQEERLKILKDLKELRCRILFSSDLTARGIDAVNVDLVINADVPNDTSTYLHRMGRAGRYGGKGVCITLAMKGAELLKFQNIIGVIGGRDLSVPVLPIESLENVLEKKLEELELICGVVDENYISEDAFMRDNIKKSVLEMKQFESKIVADNIEIVGDEKVEVEVEAKSEDVDLQQLLMSLAEGKAPVVLETEQVDNKNKRKRCSKNEAKDFDKRKINQEVEKNIALLDITRILNDDDDFSNIGGVQPNQVVSESKKELVLQEESDVENIFVHAYNYALERGEEHWKDAIGEVELVEETDNSPVENLMEQDNYDDYQEEEEDENIEKLGGYYQQNDSIDACDANNIDVRYFNQELENVNYYNRSTIFQNHYDQLSANLMNESYKFEDEQSFREWFPAWQRQVCSLTDYVQQNIYLQEMNHYQYFKNQ